jgi:hypothetical protein
MHLLCCDIYYHILDRCGKLFFDFETHYLGDILILKINFIELKCRNT